MVTSRKKPNNFIDVFSGCSHFCFLFFAIFVIFSFVFLDVSSAFAAESATGDVVNVDFKILDTFLDKIHRLVVGSDSTVLGFANSLFLKLILLDFIIAALLNVFNFGEFNQSLAMLIGKMFKYGFWLWVITNWSSGINLCNTIISSFTQVGSVVGAHGNAMAQQAEVLTKPSVIVGYGIDYSWQYFNYLLGPGGLFESGFSIWAPFLYIFRFLLAVFGGLGILIAFFLIVLNMITTMVEFYLVAGLGLILIPFSAFDKTEQFGAQNFRYVMGIGIKLMFMVAIIGLLSVTVWATTSDGLATKNVLNFTARPGIGQTILAVVLSWIYAYLACEIPAIAGSALSGSPTLSGHNLMGHAIGAAVSVGAGVRTAATAGGKLAGAGAAAVSAGLAGASAGAAFGAGSEKAANAGTGNPITTGLGAAAGAVGGFGFGAAKALGKIATQGIASEAKGGYLDSQAKANTNYGDYHPPASTTLAGNEYKPVSSPYAKEASKPSETPNTSGNNDKPKFGNFAAVNTAIKG